MKTNAFLRLGSGLTAALLAQVHTWAASDARGADEAASSFSHRVVEFHLELSRAAQVSLRVQPRQYVRAALRVGSNEFPEVGLHLKGNASFQSLGQKPSFTLKLNQFVPGQRWAGLRKIHLNNAVRDASYLCEFVGSTVCRAAGVPCPRVGHAQVRLNGRDLGLYVLAEGATRDFLDEQFGHHDGVLFEGSVRDIQQDLDLDYVGANADTNAVVALEWAAREQDLAARWTKLKRVLDLEAFTRFMAAEAVLRHWDGYTFRHANYRLYHNARTGRFQFIPHGMDDLFDAPGFPALHVARGLVARAVLEVPEGRGGYARQVAALATNAVWDALPGLVEARQALLRPVLAAHGEAEAQEQAWQSLLERLRLRLASVRAEVLAVPAGAWTNGALLGLEDVNRPRLTRSTVLVASHGPTRMDPGCTVSNLLAQAQREGKASPVPVRELRVEVVDGLWNPANREATNWCVANVWEGETAYQQVGLRLQGHSTRRVSSRYPSLTLKFNHQLPGQKFHGASKWHLHNAARDSSCLNEYVGYGVFRRAGLPAPVVEYALVTVDGGPPGLYVLVEGVTKDFLQRTFGNSGGTLYEGELTDVDGELDQDGGDRRVAGRDVAPLVAAARSGGVTNGLAELGRVLDVAQFARFMAGEILVCHADGYCLHAHNYRLYRNAPEGRFVFLPHGLDGLLANPYARLLPRMKGLLAQAMVASAEGRALYVKALRELFERAFQLEDLTGDIGAACAVIRPALLKLDAAWAERQMRAAEFLMQRLRERRREASHQLGELEFAVRSHGQVGAAKPSPQGQ